MILGGLVKSAKACEMLGVTCSGTGFMPCSLLSGIRSLTLGGVKEVDARREVGDILAANVEDQLLEDPSDDTLWENL
eukprot:9352739-Alexandrium_andersonii.AAC.1